ncbi:trypsin-like peptidase domain-containing protein [Candidatus Bathyarchaeota archaeon]|nr:trypsin-like peptidase domain-containing protein [Candidatus Bathyarchaeota archaeon]
MHAPTYLAVAELAGGDHLEIPKKQERKIAFSLIVIVLAVSLCTGTLVGYWAGHMSTSNKIDELENQLSAIQEQISNFLTATETSSQDQSDILETIVALEDELSEIQDEIDDLETSNTGGQDTDEIMDEISRLKSQLSTLQGDISNLKTQLSTLHEDISSINSTTVIYENTTYVLGENVSLSELFEQVSESVVVVEAVLSPTTGSQGSGFVYNYSGQMIILTNNHVIDGAMSINVTFSNGKTYTGSLEGSNPNMDVAVLTTSAPQSEYNPLSMFSSSTLKVGDPVIVVGTPYGLPGSMSNGIVSALDRIITIDTITLTNIIQTTAPLNPGNSGGPVMNYLGQVVGMATAIVEDSQGIGFAIPSDTILQEIMDIMS